MSNLCDRGAMTMQRLEGSAMTPTDLEKKNLETHVDLCAARYRFLEQKLETVEKKVDDLEKLTKQIHEYVIHSDEKRSDLFLKWAAGIIAVLTAVSGWAIGTLIVG